MEMPSTVQAMVVHLRAASAHWSYFRSTNAVRAKAYILGLRRPNRPPPWSKKELNVLKRGYPRRTAEAIAGQIGRPIPAVRTKIFRLGLKKRGR